jgi:hypothetical protein
VPAFSTVALACFALVGASGLGNAWTRLGSSTSVWSTGYGALVLAKVCALGVLGVLGWTHRRRTLPHLLAGRPHSFLRLATGEIAVVAATVGLAVALARTPTRSAPAALVPIPSHGAGHATLAQEVAPFTLGRLVTEWQPDAVAVSVIALALVVYLGGVRAVARRGQRWPPARTGATLLGLAVAAVATCGGFAVYAPALFSVHVARFLVMALVVPALLVLGAPLELARQGRGRDEEPVLRATARGPIGARLSDPVIGLIVFIVVTYALYATPLLELSLRSVPAHLMASTVAVVAGLILMGFVVSGRPRSRGPGEPPHASCGDRRARRVPRRLRHHRGYP